MSSFLFITEEVEFQEVVPKGARVLITALELDKLSEQKIPIKNEEGEIEYAATEYRLEDGDAIAKSLVGKNIYYGTNWKGKHDRKGSPIGIIEKTKRIGNIIKAWILVTSKDIIAQLKNKAKFLFSVGGKAQFAEVVRKAGRLVMRMVNAVCNHLQMVPKGTTVGFPNARIEKIIEINETCVRNYICLGKKSCYLSYEETCPVDVLIIDAIIGAIAQVYG